MCLRLLILALALGALPINGVAAQDHAPNSGPTTATDFVIGLSPYLDKSVKDDVYRSLVRLLVQDLPLNSTLRVYDACDLKSVTQVTLPNLRVFNSPKTRANQFASAIGELRLFLAKEPPMPSHPHLDFKDAVRLPQ